MIIRCQSQLQNKDQTTLSSLIWTWGAMDGLGLLLPTR
jgi:hypothetical protein